MNIGECGVIVGVALCVFGPKQLSTLVKHAGRLAAWFNQEKFRLMSGFKAYIQTQQLEENTKKAEEADVLYSKSSAVKFEGKHSDASTESRRDEGSSSLN